MGWQDAPLVGGQSSGGGGWQSAPPVDAPAAAAHGSIYNALFKEATPGSGDAMKSAEEGVFPAIRDYSLAGLDDVTLGLGPKLLGLTGAAARAQQNLGPMSYVTGAATYGLPGVGASDLMRLGAAGKAIGEAAPIASWAKPIAATAAEGGLAGGGWAATHGQDPVSGALTGAALGGAGGAVGAGIGKLAGWAAPPETKPWNFSANTDALEGAKTSAFKQGNNYPFATADVAPILDVNAAQIDPGLRPFVSDRLTSALANLQAHVVKQGGADANTLATYAQNLRGEFGRNPNVSKADQIVASQIADGLVGNPERQIPGVLGAATPTNGAPVGEAATWLTQANEAHRQFILAQGLQKASQAIADGTGNPASWASHQLDNFYTNADPNYAPASNPGYAAQRAALVKIANAGGGYQTAWNLVHAGGPFAGGLGGLAGEALGGAAGGWIGDMAADAAYHLFAKPAAGKVMNAAQKAATQRAIAESYQTLTGMEPPGGLTQARAPSATTVGQALKNLTVGTVY